MPIENQKLANRHKQIRRQLLIDGVVDVQSLAQYLNVSVATIRRDLAMLEEEGFAQRTHGGAIVPRLRGADQEFALREQIDPEAKQLIAREALKLIKYDQTLFMNDGSTLLALAKELVLSNLSLTVATSGVNIATTLSENPKIITYLAGGLVRHKTHGTTGDFAEQMLLSINADIAFIAAEGFTIENGLTYSYETDAKIARVMHQKASLSVAVVTNRKVGHRDRITAIHAPAVDVLVADYLDPITLKSFVDIGIKVIVANKAIDENISLNLVAEQNR